MSSNAAKYADPNPVVGGLLDRFYTRVRTLVAPLAPPPPDFDPLSANGVLAMAMQLAIGLAIGFAVQLAFDALVMAGQTIAMTMGLGFAMLVDPTLNYGLPPFLTPAPGLNSGFMIAEVTSAALMSENKQRAAPCSVDSTPTSANQEDHVSMATHAARRLGDMNANLTHIIAIELLTGAQGVELRSPLVTSTPLRAVIDCLRAQVPALADDRVLAPDIARAAELVRGGDVIRAAGVDLLPVLDEA